MAGFAEDIVSLFSGIATAGQNMFIGAKAGIPDVDTPVVAIIPTGGSGVEYVQGSAAPAYKMPSAQIVVHAKRFEHADALARAAVALLEVVKNQTVNGTWYRRIHLLQPEPFDGGEDSRGRPTAKFNVLGDKSA